MAESCEVDFVKLAYRHCWTGASSIGYPLWRCDQRAIVVILIRKAELLRRQLDDLAADVEDEFLERYELKRPPAPPGLYWKARWVVGKSLRWLQTTGIRWSEPWPIALRQSRRETNAKPLLLWAIGEDREALRSACRYLSIVLELSPKIAPVLITDVSDFSFFSRLGWLVEYVPKLSGKGVPYDERKLKFLVRLYKDAPVLPVMSLQEDCVGELPRWLEMLCDRR